MGMSTYVKGIVPPDERHLAMVAVWESCQAAEVDLPDEVEDYFDYGPPDPAGMEIDLEGVSVEWSDGDMQQGLQINMADIPSQVKIIRFVNSY